MITITNPLPTTDDDIIALLKATMLAATNEITHSIDYFTGRLHTISDYDDYIPAATTILTTITSAILDHDHESYPALLDALLADLPFIEALTLADFDTPLDDYLEFHPFDDLLP